MEKWREQFRNLKKIRLQGSPNQKKDQKHQLAKDLFELLAEIGKNTEKRFIFMLENLQDLLRDQLPEADIKLLRSFLNECPELFIIIGTALTVFNEITDYGKPFYHYFRIRSMETMSRQGMVDFLLKIAAYRKDEGLENKIENSRKYIYLFQLLTGGNPRLVLFLYDLLLGNDTLDTYMILEKITELTPYFLDKTRDESGQRKLILDSLATEAPALTAKEVADYVNEDQRSIAEQLKRLAAEGWVREVAIKADDIKRNETFYTLRDYFYRVWYQTRMKGIDESEIFCLAELAVFLFERKELEERLAKYTEAETTIKELYQRSLELALNETYMRNINILLAEAKRQEDHEVSDLLSQLLQFLFKSDTDNLVEGVRKLLTYESAKPEGYFFLGIHSFEEKQFKEALSYFREATKLAPQYFDALSFLGLCYSELGQFANAYDALSESLKFLPLKGNGIFLFKLYLLTKPDLIKKIAGRAFTEEKELQLLANHSCSKKKKVEAACRLLLLRGEKALNHNLKFILKMPSLPQEEGQKFAFFLEVSILGEIKAHKSKKALDCFLKYWVSTINKLYSDSIIESKFLELLLMAYRGIETTPDFLTHFLKQLADHSGKKSMRLADLIRKMAYSKLFPHSRQTKQWEQDSLFNAVMQSIGVAIASPSQTAPDP